jgi:hypothetical protein
MWVAALGIDIALFLAFLRFVEFMERSQPTTPPPAFRCRA